MTPSRQTALALVLLLSAGISTYAQQISPSPYFTFGRGVGIISPDSLFLLNIRFRMQNRAALLTESARDLTIDEVEARVRRLRLRFDGYVYSPRLTYLLQLSFSRGDMDFDDTGFPNVVRDAFIVYEVSSNFSIGLGQTKLPGNRQRVVSSGDLQLPDRSIVNATFNIDRDFGLQLYYYGHIQRSYWVFRGSVSSGEGRNITTSDSGLGYTGRLEWLPLGLFTNGGDYFEGDLVREPKPRISIGFTASYNQNTTRTGGQLGKFLYAPRDITTWMGDFLCKYRGWALAGEWLERTSPDPLTSNDAGELRYVYAGRGKNVQVSHYFPSKWEVVGRASHVQPFRAIQSLEPEVREWTLGVNRYVRGHRVKLQTDLTFRERYWASGFGPHRQQWQLRFQVEAGI